jgi:hypothetical protein
VKTQTLFMSSDISKRPRTFTVGRRRYFFTLVVACPKVNKTYTIACSFYPRRVGTYVQRGSKFCLVVVVVGVTFIAPILHYCQISPYNMHSAYFNIACSLARQPYPASLPGILARHPCPASLLPGSFSRQPCKLFLRP